MLITCHLTQWQGLFSSRGREKGERELTLLKHVFVTPLNSQTLFLPCSHVWALRGSWPARPRKLRPWKEAVKRGPEDQHTWGGGWLKGLRCTTGPAVEPRSPDSPAQWTVYSSTRQCTAAIVTGTPDGAKWTPGKNVLPYVFLQIFSSQPVIRVLSFQIHKERNYEERKGPLPLCLSMK